MHRNRALWCGAILLVIIGGAIGELFLLIHRQAALVKISFENQHLEKRQQEIVKECHELQEALVAAADKVAIKEYAQAHLKMKKVSLNQIRRLPS